MKGIVVEDLLQIWPLLSFALYPPYRRSAGDPVFHTCFGESHPSAGQGIHGVRQVPGRAGCAKVQDRWLEERRTPELLKHHSPGCILEWTSQAGVSVCLNLPWGLDLREKQVREGRSSRSVSLHYLLTSSRLILRVLLVCVHHRLLMGFAKCI